MSTRRYHRLNGDSKVRFDYTVIDASGISRHIVGYMDVATYLPSIQSGSYTITFEGDTTSSIAYDDPDTVVDAALNALPSIISSGGVTVSGSPPSVGGQFQILFNVNGVRSLVSLDCSLLSPPVSPIVFEINNPLQNPSTQLTGAYLYAPFLQLDPAVPAITGFHWIMEAVNTSFPYGTLSSNPNGTGFAGAGIYLANTDATSIDATSYPDIITPYTGLGTPTPAYVPTGTYYLYIGCGGWAGATDGTPPIRASWNLNTGKWAKA